MTERRTGQSVVTLPTTAGLPTVIRPAPGQQKSSRGTITLDTMRDPTKLQRHLASEQARLDDVEKRALANILGNANLIRNIAAIAGRTVYVQHRLGRAYQGFIVTRALGGYTTAVEVALPVGMSSSQAIALQFANNGTYDVLVF